MAPSRRVRGSLGNSVRGGAAKARWRLAARLRRARTIAPPGGGRLNDVLWPGLRTGPPGRPQVSSSVRGDLRSAEWRGQETTPQRGVARDPCRLVRQVK